MIAGPVLGFTSHIVGLKRWESRALLDMLFNHIASTPRLLCRVDWEPNTLTFWDNRCTQHHAVWDYYPYSRYGERVSIVGMGGYHIGTVEEEAAIAIMHEAIDEGTDEDAHAVGERERSREHGRAAARLEHVVSGVVQHAGGDASDAVIVVH